MKLYWKIVLLILFAVFLICLYVFYRYEDKNLLFLPEGEFVRTINSPNNKNKLNIYFIDGGSLSDDAMRIEFENNEDKYNIYYCYEICDIEKMNIEWKDNDNIIIDDIILNVYKDKIDRNKFE